MRAFGAALLAIGVLAAADEAAAGTLSVAPIRVELSSATRTAVLTVRNQEDTPITVQARPAAWSQPAGGEQLDDTRDVLVTPPIFTIAPKSQQVLRIALTRAPDPARELDYRLVLTELPSPTPAESTGLRVALRITLPVFVAAQTHAAPDLAWTHRWAADGTLRIEAYNRGSAHIQILDFDVTSGRRALQGLHTDNAHYLLPGTRVHWDLHPAAATDRGGELVLHGHSDAGDFTVTSSPGAP
jgi:fimbrial chaperone protein